jgi:hypothetical protein
VLPTFDGSAGYPQRLLGTIADPAEVVFEDVTPAVTVPKFKPTTV